MEDYNISITDGLAEIIEGNVPESIAVEEWMALKVEEAIVETHMQQRQQEIRDG